jgi:ABC-2 type transport system permease protein
VNVLRSEWIKLRSVRSTWIALLATVLSGVALSVLGVSDLLGSPASQLPPDWDPTATSLKGFLFAQLVIGMFGALAITAEYSTGTINTSLAVVPARSRVLAAKALIVGGGALVAAGVTTLASFGVVQALLAAADLPSAHPDDAAVVSALVGGTLFLTTVSILGLAIGTITRSTASALTVLVGVLLLVPAVGGSIGNWFSRYWPATAGQSVYAVVRTPDNVAPWLGFTILAVAVLAVMAAAQGTLARRDV